MAQSKPSNQVKTTLSSRARTLRLAAECYTRGTLDQLAVLGKDLEVAALAFAAAKLELAAFGDD